MIPFRSDLLILRWDAIARVEERGWGMPRREVKRPVSFDELKARSR